MSHPAPFNVVHVRWKGTQATAAELIAVCLVLAIEQDATYCRPNRVLATTPDLGFSRDVGEDTTILRGGTPQFGTFPQTVPSGVLFGVFRLSPSVTEGSWSG